MPPAGAPMGARVSTSSSHKRAVRWGGSVSRDCCGTWGAWACPRDASGTPPTARTAGPVAPNVLERHFEADHPNQRWTTDITFIWTWEGLAVSGGRARPVRAPRRRVGRAAAPADRRWPWRRCSWRWGDACPPPVWCTIPIGAASMPPRLISVCCASMGSSVR